MKVPPEVQAALNLVAAKSAGLAEFEAINELRQFAGKTELTQDALIRILAAEVRRLHQAISETLAENAHLADGDVCTLIKLKRAAAQPNAAGERSAEKTRAANADGKA